MSTEEVETRPVCSLESCCAMNIYVLSVCTMDQLTTVTYNGYRFYLSFMWNKSSKISNLRDNTQSYQGPKLLLSSFPSTYSTWFPSSRLWPDGSFWLGTLVIITSIARKEGWKRRAVVGGKGRGCQLSVPPLKRKYFPAISMCICLSTLTCEKTV